MHAKVHFALVIILLLSGCNPAFRNQSAGNSLNEELNLIKSQSGAGKIVFLTFEMVMTDSINDVFTIRLKNTIYADGTLKKGTSTVALSIEPNYLYYQLTNDGKSVTGSYEKVYNPLNMIYEYPGENFELNKLTAKKQHGEFVIRFQYEKDLKYISIFKPNTDLKSIKKVYHALL